MRENLPEVRREEMERAREILGVQQEWLGFMDSGLPEGDPLPPLPEGCFALVPVEEAAAPLVRILRRFRPQVVVTYDENGGYPHPDHIQTHKVSMAAIEAAADPARYPERGRPGRSRRLLRDRLPQGPGARAAGRHAQGRTRIALREVAGAMGGPARRCRVTTRVPCAEWFPVRDRALLAHATQVDPNGTWFQVPMSLQQEAWPTEDYQLVSSRVEVGPLPEDDLFAGIA